MMVTRSLMRMPDAAVVLKIDSVFFCPALSFAMTIARASADIWLLACVGRQQSVHVNVGHSVAVLRTHRITTGGGGLRKQGRYVRGERRTGLTTC